MRQRFPGAARHITATKFSSELVEILARFVLSFAQGKLQRGTIAPGFRNFAGQELQDFLNPATRSVFSGSFHCAVINILAGPAIFHDSRSLQLGEMAGNPGLAHAEDLLQLGNGQFLLLEEQEQAQAGWVGQEAEQINR
jgi:hypothetical protein